MNATRLSRLAHITFGWPFSSERFTSECRHDLTRLLRIRDLDRRAVPVYTDELPRTDVWVEPGDVVIGMDGEFRRYTWCGQPALLNQRLCRLRAAGSNVLKYVGYAVESPLRELGHLKHATTVKHLGANDIRRLAIPCWPPASQWAIAGFLDRELDRCSSAAIHASALTQVGSEAYLSEARRRILTSASPPALLKLVARPGTGHTPSRTHPEYWIEDECHLPWFGLADVWQVRDDARDRVSETAERISEVGLANSAAVRHPAGTVFMSRTASVGFVGQMAVDMAVTQDFMTWTCGPKILPEYLLHTLRACRPEIMQLVQGSTHQTIYMPDLLNIKVPLPSIDDQHQIVRDLRPRLEARRQAAPSGQALRKALAEYRDSLIHEAVTGKLDVTRVSERQMDERLHAAAEGRLDEVAV